MVNQQPRNGQEWVMAMMIQLERQEIKEEKKNKDGLEKRRHIEEVSQEGMSNQDDTL